MSVEQGYVEYTALLRTIMRDSKGRGIELTDVAPRFELDGRMFHPTTLIHIVEPLGRGAADPDSLPPALHLGPHENLRSGLAETAREFHERTAAYWRQLLGRLHIPCEWQDAVIRSAITIELRAFEETGAIFASPITSLPETDGEMRNWDYRSCRLRDAFFGVRALNRLGYVETMESHQRYLCDLVAESGDGYLQPVYGIGLEKRLTEETIDGLAGFRGNQPVRVGNQAFEYDQPDGYGSVVLAATQAFFDRWLRRPTGRATFERLEVLVS